MKKVKANEGLTVEEIIEHQKIVKPVKHVYGKYGNLALEYLKEHNVGKYWALAGSLPEYLHNVDKQADRLYMKMYEKLSNSPKFSKTGEYVHDLPPWRCNPPAQQLPHSDSVRARNGLFRAISRTR